MPHTVPPKYITEIMRTLELAGFRPYLVGGCVRDIFIGRRPNDWDMCSDALPEEVAEIFLHTVPTGIKHGTVTVMHRGKGVEITTFRCDGGYIDHRRPESVSFTCELEEDLRRRDFTINAIAMASDGTITDPFGGRDDISRRLICCVGDPAARFDEDALRMLRALRFKAQLGFELDEETLHAIWAKAPLADGLSAERVRDELQKLLCSSSPEDMQQMLDIGLLARFIRRGDISGLNRISVLPKQPRLRWCALCALLLRSGLIESCRSFLSGLRLDSSTIRLCEDGTDAVLSGISGDTAAIKHVIAKYGKPSAECACAAAEVICGTGYLRSLRRIINSEECTSLAQLAVSGTDLTELGFRGKEIGKVLDALLDHVIYHPGDNRRDILLALASESACQ